MSEAASDRWKVKPGAKVRLDEIDPGSKEGSPGEDRAATEAALPAIGALLAGLQERLYAEQRQSLLVVIQALDAGGKDGTVKHVFGHFNPQGVQVTSFKAPTEHELAHDFLWRIHQATPRRGMISVFNRSHYEDVLVVRVKDLVPESVWRPRYEQINVFESTLAAAGTRIVKLFLHISNEEQRQRLQERIDDPAKHWKFDHGDLAERARWDLYQEAFTEALERTSTKAAPWYVIPADRKWYRNFAVSQVLYDTLTDMDPQLPVGDGSLEGLVVE